MEGSGIFFLIFNFILTVEQCINIWSSESLDVDILLGKMCDFLYRDVKTWDVAGENHYQHLWHGTGTGGAAEPRKGLRTLDVTLSLLSSTSPPRPRWISDVRVRPITRAPVTRRCKFVMMISATRTDRDRLNRDILAQRGKNWIKTHIYVHPLRAMLTFG